MRKTLVYTLKSCLLWFCLIRSRYIRLYWIPSIPNIFGFNLLAMWDIFHLSHDVIVRLRVNLYRRFYNTLPPTVDFIRHYLYICIPLYHNAVCTTVHAKATISQLTCLHFLPPSCYLRWWYGWTHWMALESLQKVRHDFHMTQYLSSCNCRISGDVYTSHVLLTHITW